MPGPPNIGTLFWQVVVISGPVKPTALQSSFTSAMKDSLEEVERSSIWSPFRKVNKHKKEEMVYHWKQRKDMRILDVRE